MNKRTISRVISTITAFTLCCLLVLPYVASQNAVVADNAMTVTEENLLQPLSDDPPRKDAKN